MYVHAQYAYSHTLIFAHPYAQVLVLIAQQSEKHAFECAINAFGCMAQSDIFRSTLIERGCVTALVGAVIGDSDIILVFMLFFHHLLLNRNFNRC